MIKICLERFDFALEGNFIIRPLYFTFNQNLFQESRKNIFTQIIHNVSVLTSFVFNRWIYHNRAFPHDWTKSCRRVCYSSWLKSLMQMFECFRVDQIRKQSLYMYCQLLQRRSSGKYSRNKFYKIIFIFNVLHNIEEHWFVIHIFEEFFKSLSNAIH